jgi:hypothetical protein
MTVPLAAPICRRNPWMLRRSQCSGPLPRLTPSHCGCIPSAAGYNAHMSRRKTILFVLTCTSLLLVAACGRTTTQPAPDPRLAKDQTVTMPPAKASATPKNATPVAAPAPPRPAMVAPPTGYGWDGQASVAGFKATFDQAVNASVSALRTLGFTLDQKQSRRSIDAASLVGMNAQQRPAKVDVKPMSQTRVEVRVTVGPAGDRSSSERLLNELSKSLGGAQ